MSHKTPAMLPRPGFLDEKGEPLETGLSRNIDLLQRSMQTLSEQLASTIAELARLRTDHLTSNVAINRLFSQLELYTAIVKDLGAHVSEQLATIRDELRSLHARFDELARIRAM